MRCHKWSVNTCSGANAGPASHCPHCPHPPCLCPGNYPPPPPGNMEEVGRNAPTCNRIFLPSVVSSFFGDCVTSSKDHHYAIREARDWNGCRSMNGSLRTQSARDACFAKFVQLTKSCGGCTHHQYGPDIIKMIAFVYMNGNMLSKESCTRLKASIPSGRLLKFEC